MQQLTRYDIVPANQMDFNSFKDTHGAHLDNALLRRDELMINKNRYLCNLYYDLRNTSNFTVDQYIVNDLKQAEMEYSKV